MDKSNLRGNVRLKITGSIAIYYKKDHKLLTSKERDFPFEAKSIRSANEICDKIKCILDNIFLIMLDIIYILNKKYMIKIY